MMGTVVFVCFMSFLVVAVLLAMRYHFSKWSLLKAKIIKLWEKEKSKY